MKPVSPPSPDQPPPAARCPLGIRLVAWYLIFSASLSLLYFAFLHNHPEFQSELQRSFPQLTELGTGELLQIGLNLTLQLACGYYLLRAHALARNVHLIWNGFELLRLLIAGGTAPLLLASGVFIGCQAWLLFTPRARAYLR